MDSGIIAKSVLIFAAIVQISSTFPRQGSGLPRVDAASPEAVDAPNNLQSPESVIAEVEALIKANPLLPRLTRGEIVEILENITKTDSELAVEDRNNAERDPKALMLVMPYKVDHADRGNIEELYTKAPITRIVGAEAKQSAGREKKKAPRKPQRTKTEIAPEFKKVPDVKDRRDHAEEDKSEEVNRKKLQETRVKNNYQNNDKKKYQQINRQKYRYGNKEGALDKGDGGKFGSKEEEEEEERDGAERKKNPAFEAATVSQNPRRRVPSRRRSTTEVYVEETTTKSYPRRRSTLRPTETTTEQANQRKEEILDRKKEEIFNQENEESFGQKAGQLSNGRKEEFFNQKKGQYASRKKEEIASKSNEKMSDIISKGEISNQRKGQIFNQRKEQTSNQRNEEKIINQRKVQISNERGEEILNRGNKRKENFSFENGERFSDQISEEFSNQGFSVVNPPKFVPKPPRKFSGNLQNDPIVINDLLAQKPRRTTTKRPIIDDLSIPDHFKDVVKNIDLLMVNGDPRLENLRRETTTTVSPVGGTQMPDVSKVAEMLSPEMQELLKSFGLLPEPTLKPSAFATKGRGGGEVPFHPEGAPLSPESYARFKPLPEDAPGEVEMRKLLAEFGLADGRRQKALEAKRVEDGGAIGSSNVGKDGGEEDDLMVAEESENVALVYGKSERDGENVGAAAPAAEPNGKIPETTTEIYDKTTPHNDKEEELVRLRKLTEALEQLERLNGTASEEDLKYVDVEGLKKLVESFQEEKIATLLEQLAPDPIGFGESAKRNEVKRQKIESVTVVTPTPYDAAGFSSPSTIFSSTLEFSSPSPSSSSSTTTEEARTPDVQALADSFGGNSDDVTEAVLPEPTEAPKRTGFYYLLDWNTFFDIDNQKGQRVNLRFQPKVGDPKQFFSVNVP